MKRVYIAIPIPPRSTWRLLADPDDCPHGYMIIGTMAAVRRRRPVAELSDVCTAPCSRYRHHQVIHNRETSVLPARCALQVRGRRSR